MHAKKIVSILMDLLSSFYVVSQLSKNKNIPLNVLFQHKKFFGLVSALIFIETNRAHSQI